MSKRLTVGLLLVAVLVLSVPLLSVAGAAPKLITGADVQDDSLTGADILESSLGQVPSAVMADQAPNHVKTREGPFAEVQPGATGGSTVNCPLGWVPTGGGYLLDQDGAYTLDAFVFNSTPTHPSQDIYGWNAGISVPSDSPEPARIKAIVVCIDGDIEGAFF